MWPVESEDKEDKTSAGTKPINVYTLNKS